MVIINFKHMQKILTQVKDYLEHLEVLDITNKKSVKDKTTKSIRPNTRVISPRKEVRKLLKEKVKGLRYLQ